MNILYIVPYTPTPIRARSHNLIRRICDRGHAVTLVTTWSDSADLSALQDLGQNGVRVIVERLSRTRTIWNFARALPSSTPLQAVYSWHPVLAERLYRIADQQPFDVVHIEHLRGAQYGLELKKRRKDSNPPAPIVWDSVDCISSLFEQAASYSPSPLTRAAATFELPRTRRCERWLMTQFERTMVVSETEQLALRRLADQSKPLKGQSDKKITVLRTGVDLSFFAPGDLEREPQTIVMTGKMSYHANVAAAQFLLREVMPLVWRELPGAKLQIVGQKPPRQLARAAGAFSDRVQVVGWVPDIRAYLRRATVAVAPMVYCAGIQYKVLEAMATRTPVVATPNAVASLAVEAEQQVLVGADATSLARQIVRLQRDVKLSDEIGMKGRRYVEANHDWNQVALELENVYHQVVQESPRSARP